jgi:SMI1 / KNR4 family (SUKH-1)
VSEDQLIERIRERIKDPKKARSMPQYAFSFDRDVYPPASVELVRDAEQRMGFRLPSLLARLYTEIENGGFGPGYGLYGLEGGLESEYGGDQTHPDLYLHYLNLPEPYTGTERLLTICDWGCCMESAIDCSTPEGRMVFFPDGGEPVDEQISFAQWLEDWISDVDLFDRAYKTKRPFRDPL